jgi:hypothetical protein
MTLFFDSLQESDLGYAAIFICVGVGFLFLRRTAPKAVGPGYWAAGFFANAAGFLFWSKAIPLPPLGYLLVGELCHISGFFLLVAGAYRFVGRRYRPWNAVALALWLAVWVAGLLAARTDVRLSSLVLKLLRTVLFVGAGAIILRNGDKEELAGSRLAGWSLIAWGAYLAAFAFFSLEHLLGLAFGLLVGFQILAAFGMIVMILDRLRRRAEASERRAERLEGLLPICSYCKKIRDKDRAWHTLESYIEDRTEAEFSHGICPDCLEKHFPGQ